MAYRVRTMLAGAAALAWGAMAPAAWHEARSKHFIIYANDSPDRLERYTERVERFDAAVRTALHIADRPLTDSSRLTIFVVGNEAMIERMAGRGAAGFYASRASGSVAFVPRLPGAQDDNFNQAIFFHEYAHHLQLQNSSAAMPAWVVEGFAEFLATAIVEKDGAVLIGSAPEYRAYSLALNHGPPVDQIVAGTYGKLDLADLSGLYAKAWALTHYLTFDPARKGQLDRYLAAIQQGRPASQAATAAFGDLKALRKDLDRYVVNRIFGVRIRPEALAIAPATLRALGAGEAAIMPIRIRSQGGVDSKAAPAVALDARKVAAAYPADPAVQTALAEANYDAQDYGGADAAADRALAARPADVHSLIYKGRAQMKLAQAKAGGSDWNGARQWFLKANRADPENAEALMLFYQSFKEAGQKPTTNAVDGLLFSVALAPRDGALRMMAVRELLLEGRATDAKEFFAPIAIAPHASDKSRDRNARIMAAITAGDTAGALRLLDEKVDKAGSPASTN